MRARIQFLLGRLILMAGLWVSWLVFWLARGIELIGQFILRVGRWIQETQFPLSAIQGLVIIFLILATIYATATPAYEAGNEYQHIALITTIQRQGEMPPLDTNQTDSLYISTGYQPPLYYTLAAILSRPLGLNNGDEVAILNPYVQIGMPDAFGNKNLLVWDAPPQLFNAETIAVMLLRFVNIALAALSLLIIYASARLVYHKRPITALLATALMALNPMFLFMSASVGYLSLAILLNGIVIYAVLRTLYGGFNLITSLIAGIAFSLATLTHVGAWVLAPMLFVASLWVVWRDRNVIGLVVWLVCILGTFIVIAGGWYIRNIQLYGDPLALSAVMQIVPSRAQPFSIDHLLLEEFYLFRTTYWGLFGVANIALDNGFYTLMDILTLLGVIGFTLYILQLIAIRDFSFARYELTYVVHLLIVLGVAIAGIIFWTARTPSSYGWSLFPYASAISLLLALGLIEFIWWLIFFIRTPDDLNAVGLEAVPEKTLFNATLWPVRLIGIVAACIPLLILKPHYRLPTAIESVPQTATPVNIADNGIALVGYELTDRRYQPATSVPVTLYWRALEPITDNRSLSLTLKDPYGVNIGTLVTYPGAGRMITSQWQVNAIYPDYYEIPISPTARGRYPIQLHVSWLKESAPAQTLVNLPIGALVSNRPALSLNERPVLEEVVRFGDQIALLDFVYRDGELALLWETIIGAPESDYVAVVRVIDANGQVLAEIDHSPLLPTRYWRWGERFITTHPLNSYDPQRFTIYVGWRDESGERLGLGDKYPDNLFPLPPVVFSKLPEATKEVDN